MPGVKQPELEVGLLGAGRPPSVGATIPESLLRHALPRAGVCQVRDGELVPLSSAPDSDPPPFLRDALVALFEEERRGEELTAVVEEGATSVHAAAYTRVLDLGFAARMLLAHRAGDPAIVGVIAIEQKSGQARVVPPRVAEAIAEALTARGDVDPITCFIG